MTFDRMLFMRIENININKHCTKQNDIWQIYSLQNIIQQNDIQQNDIQQNDIQQNDIQQNDIQQNDIQQNDIQQNEIQQNEPMSFHQMTEIRCHGNQHIDMKRISISE